MSFQVNFVYRRRGKGGLRPIENESILHSGDHYKIVFTPDNDCYVYIFQVDSARQIYQLFPMREFRGVRLDNLNPVNGRRTYTLPARNKAFRLDMQVGRERIYFIASKKRNKELERLYQDLTEARKQAKEMQEEDAQAKLRWYFKRRGVGGIVTNRSLNVFWEESQDVFSILEQRLEELCEDCIHVVEFIHR